MIDPRFSFILIFIVPFLLLLIPIWVKRKDLRKLIITRGLVGGLHGMWAQYFVELFYFQPYHLSGPWGGVNAFTFIEGFACGFVTFAFLSVAFLFITKRYNIVYQKQKTTQRRLIRVGTYFAVPIIMTLLFFLIVNTTHTPPFVAFTIVCTIITLAVLITLLFSWRRMKHVKQFATRALAVTLFAAIVCGVIPYFLASIIWPGYWETTLIVDLGINPIIFGFMPLTELIYWTLMGFGTNVYLTYDIYSRRMPGENNAGKSFTR